MFLLFCPESQDGIDCHAVMNCHAESQTAGYPGDLLDHDHIAQGVHTCAAQFSGHLYAEETETAHLLHDLPGETGLLVDLLGDGGEFTLAKGAHRPTCSSMFIRKKGIHHHTITLRFLVQRSGRAPDQAQREVGRPDCCRSGLPTFRGHPFFPS